MCGEIASRPAEVLSQKTNTAGTSTSPTLYVLNTLVRLTTGLFDGVATAFVLQREIRAASGTRGPTGMYSWSTRFSFDNGIVSTTAWASSTVFASIKKITPLPSPFEYH